MTLGYLCPAQQNRGRAPPFYSFRLKVLPASIFAKLTMPMSNCLGNSWGIHSPGSQLSSSSALTSFQALAHVRDQNSTLCMEAHWCYGLSPPSDRIYPVSRLLCVCRWADVFYVLTEGETWIQLLLALVVSETLQCALHHSNIWVHDKTDWYGLHDTTWMEDFSQPEWHIFPNHSKPLTHFVQRAERWFSDCPQIPQIPSQQAACWPSPYALQNFFWRGETTREWKTFRNAVRITKWVASTLDM